MRPGCPRISVDTTSAGLPGDLADDGNRASDAPGAPAFPQSVVALILDLTASATERLAHSAASMPVGVRHWTATIRNEPVTDLDDSAAPVGLSCSEMTEKVLADTPISIRDVIATVDRLHQFRKRRRLRALAAQVGRKRQAQLFARGDELGGIHVDTRPLLRRVEAPSQPGNDGRRKVAGDHHAFAINQARKAFGRRCDAVRHDRRCAGTVRHKWSTLQAGRWDG